MKVFRIIPRYLFLGLALLAFKVDAVEDLAPRLLALQQGWAKAAYQTRKADQDAAFTLLTDEANALVTAFPQRAEPLVWDAIILSTHAGVKGGLSALGMVRQARDLLMKAESIDADVLEGSIYTTLGSLYYKVPGWPLGFGDKHKAATYLQKALALNPDGIDANYFYGDFLHEQGHDQEAAIYLRKALAAKPRPQRPLADKGRRAEAEALLREVQSGIAGNSGGGADTKEAKL